MVTVAVEVAIAGWFTSTIIGKLINKASSYFKGQKSWQSGMKAELDRLSKFQPQIETLVYAAERGDIRGDHKPRLEKWLGQLRDAVEEADNVLDELEYRHLKEEADGPPAKKLMKRVVKFGVRAVQQDDVLKRLREVVKTFDNLVACLGTLAQVLSWLDGHIATEVSGDVGRETASSFTENEFIGREKEKQMVIQWLKKKSDNKISVFSIVGVGGVGKTAVVQNIFDHPGLDFQIKMWVCVSTSFEEKVIIMNMLESLSKKKHEFATLDAAHRTLMEEIEGKKFLLVLDDVWNDKEREKWNKVMAPLKCGSEGSKILVTTRMESVADTVAKVVGETKMSLKLNGLEESDNVLLFEKYAFAGFDRNEYAKLQSIGKNIALKLMGVPLVVKTVGGMLNNKLEVKYWRRVLKDGALNSDKGTDGIMAAIRLTYEHLPPELKPCFRYCSIFPQDYMFNREQLVDMWISVGLIPGDEKGQEELANEYFETLVRKSFFEPKFSYFNMHDLLHDLAQVLSKNECLQVVSNDPLIQIPQSIRHLSIKTNNILVLKNLFELKYLRTLLLNCDVEDAESVGVNIDTALKGLKTIRYLKLSCKWLCDFPKSIGDLVHLRCLRIKRTNISKLSPCIGTLYHLQILEFTINPSLDPSELSIPADICKLSKLKRLDLPEGAISTIPHIGKLSSLQKLIGYGVKTEVGYDISELEMMSELHELEITNLENVKSTEEASKAQLNSKQFLHRIALKWGNGFENIRGRNVLDKEVADCLQPHPNFTDLLIGYGVKTEVGYDISELEMMSELHELEITNLENVKSTEEASKAQLNSKQLLRRIALKRGNVFENMRGRNVSDKEVADCLQPHPNLTDLLINGYRGTNLPNWLTPQFLPNLTAIDLDDCSSLERLPPFGQFPYLKILTLKTLMALKVIGLEFYGSSQSGNTFPALETLELVGGLMMLEEWREDTQSENCLPCLKRLVVGFCPSLKKLPPIPTTLKELELNYVEIATFPGYKQKNEGSSTSQGPWSLSSLFISGCSKLTSLKSGFFMHPEQLASLEQLEISYCDKLVSLPSEGFRELVSLKSLKIWKCDKLVSLPSEGFRELVSLKSLEIENCRRIFLLPMLLPKNFIPSSVQQLNLGSCGDLAASLPQLLQDLSLLSFLDLKNCANLISLPSANVLQSLTSLKTLNIQNCERLKSLGGLEAIPSLKLLMIRQCPMLATNSSLVPIEELPRNRLSMELYLLVIDEPNLLLVVPLRNLHLTKSLDITGDLSTMLLLLDQWFVQKLPNLRVLVLRHVYSLMRLPALPRSLESLTIDGCNEELAGTLEEGGLDYDKLRHLDVSVYGVKSQLEISQLFS